MNILHITNTATPHGGVFRYLFSLSRKAMDMDKEISMKTLSIKYEQDSVSDYSLGLMIPKDLLNMQKINSGLEHAIDDFRPDIVHLHDITIAPYPTVSFLNRKKIRYVYTLHNISMVCPNGMYFKGGRECDKSFSFGCVGCIRNRNHLYNFMSDWLVHSNNADKARYHISTSKRFSELYKNSGLKNVVDLVNFSDSLDTAIPDYEVMEDNTFLYVGRLDYEKNPMGAAKVVPLLKNSKTTLRIAGKGPDIEQLRAFVDSHGLGSRIELLGFVTEDQLHELYRRSLVFVHPTIRLESSSLVLFEAMAWGKACMVADKGMVSEIIEDGVNGVLFDPSDLDGFAKKLDELMADREYCIMMGKKAAETAHRLFSFRTHYDRLKDIYRRALEE